MKVNGTIHEGFTAAWAERMALYMTDIEILPAKTWKKIMSAALKIIEEKKGASKPASTAKAPQRHQIVDVDESE